MGQSVIVVIKEKVRRSDMRIITSSNYMDRGIDMINGLDWGSVDY